MMKKEPLFSILIANYNNGKYLMEAIESVRQQTYANWEIVLVDDGSSDNSEEVYAELEKDERICIFRNEKNMGCGYTKHRCVELAKGELCGFLDPDDALVENALELEAKIHVEHPEVSVVYSKCLICDTDFNVMDYGRLPEIQTGETYLEHRTHGALNFASYKKAYYDRTDGINPRLKAGVDQDLYFRIEEVGEIYLLDEYTYKYVVVGHDNALSASAENMVPSWYWNLSARRDAFLRRGIPEDELIDDFRHYLNVYAQHALYKQEKVIRSSKAYRLGKAILKPFEWIKRLV